VEERHPGGDDDTLVRRLSLEWAGAGSPEVIELCGGAASTLAFLLDDQGAKVRHDPSKHACSRETGLLR